MKKIINLSLFLLLLIIQIHSKKNNLRQVSDDVDYTEYHLIKIKDIVINHPDNYLIDTREIDSSEKFIKNSIIIPLTIIEKYLPVLIPEKSQILLICDKNNYKDSLKKVENIGSYKILGYSIFEKVINEGDINIKSIDYKDNSKKKVDELVSKGKTILDVREIKEYQDTGVIKGSTLIPLSQFNVEYNKLPQKGDIYIFCKTGTRAVMAMTFAIKMGYTNRFYIMKGGMDKLVNDGYHLEEYDP